MGVEGDGKDRGGAMISVQMDLLALFMLGFLGTVSGMIRAFGEIAAAKNVEASLVAGGIQEALITTATGLIIAIPIQMSNNFFIAKIGRFVIDMEEASSILVDTLADMEHLKQL